MLVAEDSLELPLARNHTETATETHGTPKSKRLTTFTVTCDESDGPHAA